MTLNISDTFEEYGIDDIDELNEIEFAAIEYKNEEIHYFLRIACGNL